MSEEEAAGKRLSNACQGNMVDIKKWNSLKSMLVGEDRNWKKSPSELTRIMGHVFREVKVLIVQNGGFYGK